MKNLLQINTVPVKIEVNVTRASLESPGKQLPRMNVKTNKGGYQMEARPAKLNIDTYQARASTGLGKMNMSDFYGDEVQRSIKLAYQGTARVVEEGNALARGSTPSEIARNNARASFKVETMMDFIPKKGADLTYEDGVLNINYQLDDVNVDWEHLDASRLIFNPGNVEINVAQYGRVEIEYIGEPIYVPPSASPNYEPILNVLG
jgi:hypothetical protein